MPAPILSLARYMSLLEAYRIRPGAYRHAAKQTGVAEPTARRYWLFGHPDAPDIRKRPIQDVLKEEQETARARLVELQDKTEQLQLEIEAQRRAAASAAALKDSTDTRVAEAQLIRLARGATTGVLVSLTGLTKGLSSLSKRVAVSLEELGKLTDAAGNALPSLSLGEMDRAVTLVRDVTSAIRAANEAGKQAMEMERLLLGEPTSHVQHHHLVEVTVDEAERRMAAGQRALERAKARGFIVEGRVLPGPGAPVVPPAVDPGPATGKTG
jgi:hypothetical protein